MIFNVRGYGVLLNPSNEFLISDESINRKHYTKFPRGGLKKLSKNNVSLPIDKIVVDLIKNKF